MFGPRMCSITQTYGAHNSAGHEKPTHFTLIWDMISAKVCSVTCTYGAHNNGGLANEHEAEELHCMSRDHERERNQRPQHHVSLTGCTPGIIFKT